MSSNSSRPSERVRIGTSGWRYASWRGDFYPDDLPHRSELSYLANRVSTVELNGSFYSLQRPSSFLRWRESVPQDFVFAVKGSRYITHMLRLRDSHAAMANFFASGVLALGSSLGPILWQLPERQEFDRELLAEFLSALPRSTAEAQQLARAHDDRVAGRSWLDIDADRPIRHALEPRAASFHDSAAIDLLQEQRVALTIADTAGRWPRFDAETADFTYVRLHGSTELYRSGYTEAELRTWADAVERRAAAGSDVFAYFDNDARGHAPHDAVTLARLLGVRPGA